MVNLSKMRMVKKIKREVATMDDGLIFGGNTGEHTKQHLVLK